MIRIIPYGGFAITMFVYLTVPESDFMPSLSSEQKDWFIYFFALVVWFCIIQDVFDFYYKIKRKKQKQKSLNILDHEI